MYHPAHNLAKCRFGALALVDLADAADEIRRKREALGAVECVFILFTQDDLPELSEEQARQLLHHFLHFHGEDPLYDRLHQQLNNLADDWADDAGRVQ